MIDDDDEYQTPEEVRHRHLISQLALIASHLRHIRSMVTTIGWMLLIAFFALGYHFFGK